MADAKLLYVLPPTAISRWRDRCAWRAANFILNHVATKNYRDRLQLCIERGLRLRAMDEHTRTWADEIPNPKPGDPNWSVEQQYTADDLPAWINRHRNER